MFKLYQWYFNFEITSLRLLCEITNLLADRNFIFSKVCSITKIIFFGLFFFLYLFKPEFTYGNHWIKEQKNIHDSNIQFKYFLTDNVNPFYGEVTVSTGEKGVPVSITISKSYRNRGDVYKKTAYVRPFSNRNIKFNSYQLEHDGYYHLEIMVHNEYSFSKSLHLDRLRPGYIIKQDLANDSTGIDFYTNALHDQLNFQTFLLKDFSFNKTLKMSRNFIINHKAWQSLSKDQPDNLRYWLEDGGHLVVPGRNEKQILKQIKYNSAYPRTMLLNRINSTTPGRFTPLEFEKLKPEWEISKINLMIFIPLVILFALTLGPGMVFYSKKKNKPLLILLMVPILSIVFSIIIVIFSILQSGITPKVNLKSISFLDQNKGEVFIQQFSGIESPLGGPGIAFPEDAYIHPINNKHASCIAANGEMLFQSQSIPARIPVFFYMSRHFKDRKKVIVKEEVDGISVTNGLGTKLDYIKINTGDKLYYYDQAILPGKRIRISHNYLVSEAKKKSKLQKITSNPFFYKYKMVKKHSSYDVQYERLDCDLAKGCFETKLRDNVFGVDIYKGDRINVGNNYNLLIGSYKEK